MENFSKLEESIQTILTIFKEEDYSAEEVADFFLNYIRAVLNSEAQNAPYPRSGDIAYIDYLRTRANEHEDEMFPTLTFYAGPNDNRIRVEQKGQKWTLAENKEGIWTAFGIYYDFDEVMAKIQARTQVVTTVSCTRD